jgi:prepilin-type N-terminal cleavage/methylation domain-containing protein
MDRRISREGGFTIIEVLVAVLIVAMGALATFGLLSDAIKNTARAKGTQIALDRAQQEMEALRSLSNKQLAMTAAPAASADRLNPDYRVSGGTFALTREPRGSYANMVVNGGALYGGGSVEGGVVNPGPTSFTSGDVSGKVYRYVVWRNDVKCGTSCPGGQDFKQIVVAVKMDAPVSQGGERGYVEVQSDFVDPTHSPKSDPLPGSNGQVVTAQQFFLTDTPCSSSGKTERQEITGDHLLHNTLGTCASGAQVERTPGAPDALLLGGPADPAPEDPNNPPLYDYSSDPYLEPTLNPEQDKGLQIRPDEKANGCLYSPQKETTSLHPESQVHRWVTDPFASGFTLSGKITLEFYTRTINEAQHKGTLCVYLYKRHETGSPPTAEDAILANAKGGTGYWAYTPEGNANWPSTEWKRIRLTMEFLSPPYTIPAGDRLGVALSVERANTPAEAIQIMYDHPQYPARLEVDTNTPIEGG